MTGPVLLPHPANEGRWDTLSYEPSMPPVSPRAVARMLGNALVASNQLISSSLMPGYSVMGRH